MFAIAFHELKRQIKSIKSILIICIIFSITIAAASIANNYKGLMSMETESNVYTLGLTVTTLVAGPLFTLALSHNIINEEIKNRTIRFIATKTSRFNIVVGKFLGLSLFWFTCLFISMILISFIAHSFYLQKVILCFSFFAYFIGLAILISVLINNPTVTNILGVSLSFIFTVLGIWSTMSQNILLKTFSYLTPYNYFIHHDNDVLGYVPIVFSLLFTTLGLNIMKRRDL
ncbi:ABC transporter permease [Staphylococcus canis]|uniref:ABC transporter permease subunit n=1 Tax=Staphylococcus canis TaxID=2724942 RepID=A0ABS0TB78_9STAP|nr:ABC transporter permease subunit [Staphylococcus canis]MBI5976004.1 ABC transporter permease subunit [Staphylococcus canis]